MKIFLTVIITLLVLAAAGLVVVYSGVYNVSAMNPEGSIGAWFFSTVMDHSVAHHSNGINVPPLTDSTLVDGGFQMYSRMCVGCHGAPGVATGRLSKGLNPPPPDLSAEIGDLSDANLFWIIKNGIKMTGMPSYGVGRTDDELWKLVAFVHLLPKMTDSQFQQFRDRLPPPNEQH
jgi:mono/diheme cytochrome c family protein